MAGTRLKRAFLWGLVFAASALHAAALSPETSRRAIQEYRKTIIAADNIDALQKHWSADFKKQQARLTAEQLASLPPDGRAAYKRTALEFNKEMARAMPENAEATCEATRCKVVAKTATGSTQTFLLKEEKGLVVIDEVHLHFDAR